METGDAKEMICEKLPPPSDPEEFVQQYLNAATKEKAQEEFAKKQEEWRLTAKPHVCVTGVKRANFPLPRFRYRTLV